MPIKTLTWNYSQEVGIYIQDGTMKKLSVTDAATLIGISRDKIRYWMKLLGLEITKKGRVSYISPGAEKLLLAMANSVSSGLAPSVAAKEVLHIHSVPESQQSEMQTMNNSLVIDRIQSLEKAVMLLVEQNKILSATNAEQSKLLNKRLDRIEFKIAPPQTQKTKQIKVWKPTEPTRPKYSTLQRIWYEVTNPQKLRAN